jgi:hypothetical protein
MHFWHPPFLTREGLILKKSLFLISIATLLALTSIPAKALDDNLVYVAVEPCRLVDTRKTSIMAEGVERGFEVSGASLSGQGGDAGGCLHPRAGTGVEPLAASVYLVAIRDNTVPTGSGWLTAFPSDQGAPGPTSVATINYSAGQVIGNTTNVTLCPGSGCLPGGPLGLVSYNSDQDVVIDVQGYFYPAAGSCSDDMVAAGSLCVDKYEASVWNAATGGTQYNPTGDPGTFIPCDTAGADCSDGAATPIYARSVAGVIPALNVTWYQAAIACANVDKRLPTTAEWQMAAAGTPEGTGTDCNAVGGAGAVTTTGAGAACLSTTGAYDMIGNLAEWAAELDNPSSGTTITTNNTIARGLGQSWALNGGEATTRVLWRLAGTGAADTGPLTTSSRLGFRCVR